MSDAARPAPLPALEDLAAARRAAPAPPTPQEIAERVEQAEQEGRARGHQQGLVDAAADVERLAVAFTDALDQRDQQLAQIAQRLRDEAVELGLELARRITSDHLDHHPDAVQNALGDALQMILDAETVRVRVHPDDAALIDQDGDPRLTVHADPAVQRGGCVLESDIGDVDATVQTRVRRAVEAVRAAREPQ